MSADIRGERTLANGKYILLPPVSDPRFDRLARILVLSLVIGILYLGYMVAISPSVKGLDRSEFAQASIVFAANGEVVTRYYEQNRTWVPIDSIAPSFIQALLATEDTRFYKHDGIDVRRTIGAIFRTLSGDQQGGSTLTMQLARNAFPEIQQDFILTRKVKEWITAIRLESRYSKAEILEMYVNTVPFLYNSYGVEAAAQTYFDKDAIELDTLESATLVGMLKGPSLYNPKANPEISQQRRNVVLSQMQKAGHIPAERLEILSGHDLKLNFNPTTPENNLAPYFAEHVRQQLNVWARKHGYDLYRDGLRVYTTLDPKLQRAAEEALETTLADLQAVVDVSWSRSSAPMISTGFKAYKTYREKVTPFAHFWKQNQPLLDRLVRNTDRYRALRASGTTSDRAFERLKADEAFMDSLKTAASRLQAGFVAIDRGTGHVKAWVGGSGFTDNKYDHVVQAHRQPGSTFKPFVYAAALASGYSPDDALIDARMTYVNHQTGQVWSPGNFEDETGGAYTLRKALAYSKNTVTAQLTMKVGPERVAAYANRMGIRSKLLPVPSIGLGTSELTLYELTSAYATLADFGRQRDPLFITRIEDRHGKVLARFGNRTRQVISPTVAAGVVEMMRGVVDFGTGVRIRSQYGVKGELAGKTGTTQRAADGWFMLIHPDLVMGSWVGFDQPGLTFRTNWWGQGAHTALHMVGRFMKQASLPVKSFSSPPDVDFEEKLFVAKASTGWEPGWKTARASRYEVPYHKLSPTDRLTRLERRSSKVSDLAERIRSSRDRD